LELVRRIAADVSTLLGAPFGGKREFDSKLAVSAPPTLKNLLETARLLQKQKDSMPSGLAQALGIELDSMKLSEALKALDNKNKE